MQKILLIGGQGYLGKYITKNLNKKFFFINPKKKLNILKVKNLQNFFDKDLNCVINLTGQIGKNVKKINKTQEVLFIKSGKLRIDLYSSTKYYKSFILNKGDIIFLSSGGHGFKMLKPTEIIEVKQGPYSKFNDKIFLDPVNEKKIKIKKK